MIEITVEDLSEPVLPLEVNLAPEDFAPLSIEEHIEPMDGSNDYEKLKHLPKLNGQTIIGDVSEIDPTVPSWAKETNKPQYSADEINAVPAEGAITIAELARMFG